MTTDDSMRMQGGLAKPINPTGLNVAGLAKWFARRLDDASQARFFRMHREGGQGLAAMPPGFQWHLVGEHLRRSQEAETPFG